MYYFQKYCKPLNLSRDELLKFFGMTIYKSIHVLPAIVDYWAEKTYVTKIASVMTKNRYLTMRNHLHVVENDENQKNSVNRFPKIRPLFDIVNENCKKFSADDGKYSIDETIVPYKGKKGGSDKRQYNPKKPTKWGYKIISISDINGQIFGMILYQGKTTLIIFKDTPYALTDIENSFGCGPSYVITLLKFLRNSRNIIVYIDNYFTSIKLFIYLLEKRNVYAVETCRRDRIENCDLESDKTSKKIGRGATDFKSFDNQFILVKYLDNKPMHKGSTVYGIDPSSTLLRYSKEEKKKSE